jgi:hypothetical protein
MIFHLAANSVVLDDNLRGETVNLIWIKNSEPPRVGGPNVFMGHLADNRTGNVMSAPTRRRTFGNLPIIRDRTCHDYGRTVTGIFFSRGLWRRYDLINLVSNALLIRIGLRARNQSATEHKRGGRGTAPSTLFL